MLHKILCIRTLLTLSFYFLLDRFSYVSFGKQWHGPFTPRWSKLIPVVRVALGAPLHDWAILMTQIVIADDNDLDKPIDALDLEKPLRVSLDTGTFTDGNVHLNNH